MTESPVGGAAAIELRGVSQRYITDCGDVVHAVETDLTIPADEVVRRRALGAWQDHLAADPRRVLKPVAKPSSTGVQSAVPRATVAWYSSRPNPFPWLTVRKNVELRLKWRDVQAAERRTRSGESLEMVDLAGCEDRKPYELSGGMQRRAQIARVLANDPDTILMDEPFGALDALTREVSRRPCSTSPASATRPSSSSLTASKRPYSSATECW